MGIAIKGLRKYLGIGKFALTLLASSAFAASESEREIFRQAIIGRGCTIDSTQDGREMMRETGFSKYKFAEIMIDLALEGEFICNSGCLLVSPRCIEGRTR